MKLIFYSAFYVVLTSCALLDLFRARNWSTDVQIGRRLIQGYIELWQSGSWNQTHNFPITGQPLSPLIPEVNICRWNLLFTIYQNTEEVLKASQIKASISCFLLFPFSQATSLCMWVWAVCVRVDQSVKAVDSSVHYAWGQPSVSWRLVDTAIRTLCSGSNLFHHR